MSYTIDQLVNLDPKIFGEMKKEELEEIKEMVTVEKKRRVKEYIKPVEKEHVKPVQDKYIKPLKEKHTKDLDKLLKDLKTYLPKKKAKKAFITINGTRFGPLTKKEFMEMITEVDDDEEQE
jgi:hypothetical protein